MATAIEFNHVGKQYRLGLVSTGTISHDLNRWWQTAVLRKEDPYLKIGSVNDRTQKADSDYVWALRDIDFKVEQGDVVGIIGKNGAGKSTLLKLLSKVTGPTVGSIRARGRIASLLEVGTGFHQEMTGRENIYMNGAILGMKKREIDSLLDEIIAFSGCEKYIDTPVKRYSSGMTVRLGFAVAAHLDPEILVVDEVLAVGDAEFQKKAIGKMRDVSKGEGRTVLFVSHSMASIRALCKNGILLENGGLKMVGNINDVVDKYVENILVDDFSPTIEISKKHRPYPTNRELEFISAAILNNNEKLATDELLHFVLHVKNNDPTIKRFTVGLMIDNNEEMRVGSYVSPVYDVPLGKKEFDIHIKLAHHNLARGTYRVGFNIGHKELAYGLRDYDVVHPVLMMNIVNLTINTPIVLWQKQWGSINYHDAEIEIK